MSSITFPYQNSALMGTCLSHRNHLRRSCGRHRGHDLCLHRHPRPRQLWDELLRQLQWRRGISADLIIWPTACLVHVWYLSRCLYLYIWLWVWVLVLFFFMYIFKRWHSSVVQCWFCIYAPGSYSASFFQLSAISAEIIPKSKLGQRWNSLLTASPHSYVFMSLYRCVPYIHLDVGPPCA